MNRIRPHPANVSPESGTGVEQEEEHVSPLSIAALLSICLVSLLISDWVSAFSVRSGFTIPSVLVLTTISLLIAQSGKMKNLAGANLLGMLSIYLFLVVVGAFCELDALLNVGERAMDILLFTTAIVIFHGIFLITLAIIFKIDWVIIAIASQANIGGAGTALALARSFDRKDLLLPAILVGSLGTGIGTYLGFLVAGLI